MRQIWCDIKSYMCRMKPCVKQADVSSTFGHLPDVCVIFFFFFWGDVIARLPGSIHLSLNLYVGKWKAHHASSIPHSADLALWQTLQDEFISAESLHLWEIYEDVSFNWGPPSEVSSTLCAIDRRWHFIRWLFNLGAWQKSGTVMRLLPPHPHSRKQLLWTLSGFYLSSPKELWSRPSCFLSVNTCWNSLNHGAFDTLMRSVSGGERVEELCVCVSPKKNELVSEGIDRSLRSSCFAERCYVYYVYCGTYCCSSWPMHSYCRKSWIKTQKTAKRLFVHVCKYISDADVGA